MTDFEPIRVRKSVWEIGANPGHIEGSAQDWRNVGTASVGCGDGLVEATRTLLGSEWSGPARDTFDQHQSKLVAALDAVQVEGDKVATTLDGWAAILRLYQASLDGEFDAIAGRVRVQTTRLPFAVEWVTFLPSSAEQVAAVNTAVQQANTTRAELEAALWQQFREFRVGDWDTLAAEWLLVAEGAVQPFVLPAEAAGGTSVIMVDGRAVVNTGNGDDKIKVTVDPQTGEVIVTVNGIEHQYPRGTPVTIRGGEGNDTIDIPKGMNVKVTLLGGAGDDVIHGGDGDEVILGGHGSDEIYGGRGDDYASGGSGHDYIDGQGGSDTLAGGLGDDVIYGLGGHDYLSGGEGSDYLEGARGSDELAGGAGADILSGGRGDDRISGGIGDDVMYGGQGTDSLAGAGGRDTAYRQDNDSVSRVSEDVRVEITGDTGFIKIEGSDEFIARVQADLEMYRGSPTGQQMLENLSDNRDPNWGIGENKLVIREWDAENAETDTDSTWVHDSTTVSYNPTLTYEASGRPSLALYHEFAHIYDFWNDTFDDDEISGGTDDGEIKGEYQATGLPIDHDDDSSTPDIIDPDHPRVYTENALRDEMNLPKRDTYESDGL